MSKQNLLGIIMVVLFGAATAYAQSGLGEITGFIFDEDAKGVDDVSITVESESLLGTRTISSGNKGYYRIINLPPGNYRLIFTKDNYQRHEINGVSVRAGKTSSFNVTLKVGSFQETIIISGDAPIIDLKTPERSINVDGDFIQRMPLNPSRDWFQVWTLVPGVDYEGDFSNDSFRQFRAKVHGANDQENQITMDGMSVVTTGAFQPVNFSTAIIEDVEIVTSGIDASVQPGVGGYINVITKSGGNDFHGTASLVLQPESWNWSNVEDGTAPELSIVLPELSIGGPIFRDRTWFFAAYLYDDRAEGIFRTAEAQQRFVNVGFEKQDWKKERSSNRFFGKITHALADTQRLVFSFNWDRTEDTSALSANRTTESGLRENRNGGPFASLTYDVVLSDSLNLNLAASYRSADLSTRDKDGLGPLMVRYESSRLTSRGRFGNGTSVLHNGIGQEFLREDEHVELRGDAIWFLEDFFGSQELKFGVYYLPHRRFRLDYNYFPVFSIIETLDDAGNVVPYQRTEYEPQPRPSSDNFMKQVAIYGQDSWTLNNRLTLSFGVRGEKTLDDLETLGRWVFSPNAGATYAFTNEQSLSFSFSRRSEYLNNTEILDSVRSNARGNTRFFDDDLDGIFERVVVVPSSPPVFNTPGDIVVNNFPVRIDEDLTPAHTDAFHLGYTAVIPFGLTFNGSFIYKISADAISVYNANNIFENGEFVGLIDESVNWIRYYRNNEWSSSHYWSTEFTLTKPFSNGWQMIASYTRQDATLKGEWSPLQPEYHHYPSSWFETAHNGNLPSNLFKLAASFLAPYDIIVNTNISYRDGDYLSPILVNEPTDVPRFVQIGGRNVFNPLFVQRPLYQARNTDREKYDGRLTVNVGLGKEFTLRSYRISTQFQVFNLFNSGGEFSANFFNHVVNADGSPYRDEFRFNSIQAPRAAQLLVKLHF